MHRDANGCPSLEVTEWYGTRRHPRHHIVVRPYSHTDGQAMASVIATSGARIRSMKRPIFDLLSELLQSPEGRADRRPDGRQCPGWPSRSMRVTVGHLVMIAVVLGCSSPPGCWPPAGRTSSTGGSGIGHFQPVEQDPLVDIPVVHRFLGLCSPVRRRFRPRK